MAGELAGWIMVFAKICETALSLGKTLKEWKAAELTDREKDLLRAAATDGQFHLLCNEDDGKHVFTQARQFAGDDRAIAAHYLDAFTSLCNRGLIVHQYDDVFQLTGQGFDIARDLPPARG